MNAVGLFRQTGRATQISKLKDQFNQGKLVQDHDRVILPALR